VPDQICAADADAGAAVAAVGDAIDRQAHAAAARLTGGLSPVSLLEAWQDWALHMAASPGRRWSLCQEAGAEAFKVLTAPASVETKADPRFREDGWRQWPFSAYAAGFQACERWWRTATTEVPGVQERNERIVAFAARQLLDTVSPSNFAATNPEVLARVVATGGASIAQGASNLVEDMVAQMGAGPAPSFKVGRDVALTPGEVVARTALAEIIQYRPTTGTVHPEPVVIVPAWINRYYILDLTPQDSLVRTLVAEGFTVFIVSWKNPGAEDRDLGFEDYRKLGALAAIDVAAKITGSATVNAVGYCLGGTLLLMTAAAMARDGDQRIGSLTLLASQADFTEAGELTLFVTNAQIALLEDLMWERGYLRPEQMSGAFQLLQSNDLIWSRMIHEYLMGEPRTVRSLDAWSQDATRLPFRMESENLRGLYLNNDLAEGRFCADGKPVALRDITAPMFVLGTETDHIAPWRSVYKLLLLCKTDITFTLTNHGHNVGVIAAPGTPGHRHRVRRQRLHGAYVAPDAWFAKTPPTEGSWQPVWLAWLAARSGAKVAPPPLGVPSEPGLGAAPGSYVLQP
jgi:polyhydroxyalkanoate synthase